MPNIIDIAYYLFLIRFLITVHLEKLKLFFRIKKSPYLNNERLKPLILNVIFFWINFFKFCEKN